MQKLQKKWRIEVLHHSHTDIGYTERQEFICRQHADFLRQVLDILRRIEAGEAEEQRGFAWQCENYWQIENFLRSASEKDRADLIRLIRAGRIGLSASYLNRTDLIDETGLEEHPRADGERRQHERRRKHQREGYQALPEPVQPHRHQPDRAQRDAEHGGRFAHLRHLVELQLHERGQHDHERHHRPQRAP